MRAWKVFVYAAFFFCANANAQSVNIGVLGIFRPKELTIIPAEKQELLVSAAGQSIFVAAGSGCGTLQIRIAGDALLASCGKKELRAKEIHAAGRNRDAADFVLTIPGKIKRNYRGALRVITKDGVLMPIVTMDLEIAVGSVVRAEMTEDTRSKH
jgi:hypothetical protein